MADSKHKLTHFDEKGRVKMVEVSAKDDTLREAVARGFVRMSTEVLELMKKGSIKKGDPMEVARIAGIMAAKKTHELIPLCHPLLLTNIEVHLNMTGDGIEIESKVVCMGKTGVEMEALTAVSVAGLTLYDMCKSVDKKMKIDDITLVKKSGGRSGTIISPVMKKYR